MPLSRVQRQILLRHLGGSTKFVEVLRAFPILNLDIRWDISGIYVLDLKTNKLKDGKLARGGMANWKAADLETAKQLYWSMIHPQTPIIVQPKPLIKAEERSMELTDICNCRRSYCDRCEKLRKSI